MYLTPKPGSLCFPFKYGPYFFGGNLWTHALTCSPDREGGGQPLYTTLKMFVIFDAYKDVVCQDIDDDNKPWELAWIMELNSFVFSMHIGHTNWPCVL